MYPIICILLVIQFLLPSSMSLLIIPQTWEDNAVPEDTSLEERAPVDILVSNASRLHDSSLAKRYTTPKWDHCVKNNRSSEWGYVMGGCHNKHVPLRYLAKINGEDFTKNVRNLLNRTLGQPMVTNNPRSACTVEQGERLCVSWSNDVHLGLEDKYVDMMVGKARECIFWYGMSSQGAFWTLDGERVYVCVSNSPRNCSWKICLSGSEFAEHYEYKRPKKGS